MLHSMNDDLLDADRALAAALARGDAGAAVALLDDDFTWVDSHGRSLSKQQAASRA